MIILLSYIKMWNEMLNLIINALEKKSLNINDININT